MDGFRLVVAALMVLLAVRLLVVVVSQRRVHKLSLIGFLLLVALHVVIESPKLIAASHANALVFHLFALGIGLIVVGVGLLIGLFVWPDRRYRRSPLMTSPMLSDKRCTESMRRL